MRKIIIAGNWKMNKTLQEAKDFLQKLSNWEKDFAHQCVIAIYPSNVFLNVALGIVKNNAVQIGAQNVYFEKSGAFTGEISPEMLSSIGCNSSLVGHSERRHIFGEDDELLNKKVKALLNNQQEVTFCIGETELQRENEETEKVLEHQLKFGLKDVPATEMRKVVLAYEPVWAIGTGKTATPAIAQEAHLFIRNWLQENYGEVVADKISILYGGSVKVANIEALIVQPDIDGALIGGASLKVEDFTEIIFLAEKNK